MSNLARINLERNARGIASTAKITGDLARLSLRENSDFETRQAVVDELAHATLELLRLTREIGLENGVVLPELLRDPSDFRVDVHQAHLDRYETNNGLSVSNGG